MSLSEHLTSCGAWTGHSCTCWLDRPRANQSEEHAVSAMEEYRAFVGAADGYATRDLADAAIAELEAENKQQRKQFTAERCAELMTALEKAEAELVALMARRCEGCHYVVFDDECQPFPWYCTCGESMLHDSVTDPDFSCNRWAERSKP